MNVKGAKTIILNPKKNGSEDVRSQFYRWFSYQFSHIGIKHVGMNMFMNLIMGIPLEKFHGTSCKLASTLLLWRHPRPPLTP